jgi:hypothetical protein
MGGSVFKYKIGIIFSVVPLQSSTKTVSQAAISKMAHCHISQDMLWKFLLQHFLKDGRLIGWILWPSRSPNYVKWRIRKASDQETRDIIWACMARTGISIGHTSGNEQCTCETC